MADFRPTKKAESDKREAEAWELRAKGWSHQRIAEKLEVDVSTISKAIKRATEKHHEKFMANIHEYKKQQAKVIEDAAYNALEQYYKSQKAKNIVTKSGKVDAEGKFIRGAVTTIQKIDQYGDSRLLGMFYKGMEDIRKIWGFDNIQRGGNGGDGKPNMSNLSIDEKVAMFCSLPIEERLRLLDSMITIRPTNGELSDDTECPDSE